MKLQTTDIDKETLSIEEEPLYTLDDISASVADEFSTPEAQPAEDASLTDSDDEDISMLFGPNHSNTETQQDGPVVMLLILDILLNPVNGWKRLHSLRLSPGYVAMRSLLPMAALAGLSKFADLIYDGRESFATLFSSSLIYFLAFFFGYFLIRAVSDFILPSYARENMRSDKGRNFLLVVLSTLAFFFSLPNIFPMLEPILVFLPLWTLYIIFRGMKALRIKKDKENVIATILSFLVCGVPLLCSKILESCLPRI